MFIPFLSCKLLFSFPMVLPLPALPSFHHVICGMLISFFPSLICPEDFFSSFMTATLHPHHQRRARSFRIWSAPPAGLEDSAVTWICSPPVPAVHTEAAGVRAVSSKPRAISHPRHGQCPCHPRSPSPGRFSVLELLKVAQLWLGDPGLRMFP